MVFKIIFSHNIFRSDIATLKRYFFGYKRGRNRSNSPTGKSLLGRVPPLGCGSLQHPGGARARWAGQPHMRGGTTVRESTDVRVSGDRVSGGTVLVPGSRFPATAVILLSTFSAVQSASTQGRPTQVTQLLRPPRTNGIWRGGGLVEILTKPPSPPPVGLFG